MTVSTEINHEEYVGNGVTYVFPYRFRILKASNMVVVLIDPNGTETTLILNTGFTVSGVGSYAGGNVTLPSPLAAGWGITLTRDLPAIQETDLRNQGTFFAETHEDAFDYLTMLIQQGQRAAEIINLRALRVPESSVALVPRKSQRANKILAFNGNGDPMVVLPPNGSASDVMIELAKPTGASLVGVQPQGNLQQLFFHVTPEQFGAIGDGTVHPLSERYATLAAAQAVYPHVTSLSQTIDWAACQGAENYARGVTTVKCPTFTKYHFGSTDYLALGVDSKWQGSANPQWHSESSKGTTMIRTSPTTAVQFGKDAVVRVMDASDAGSPDEAVRGISFKGFYLSRGRVGRRFPTKGTNSICLHMNMAIKAEIDVAVAGAEFGFFGYGCWGTTGIVRIDSCHKGYYVKPDEATPERPVASGTITALDLRLEIDATPFPITMSNTYYSKINGFFEGVLVGMTNYDSANETAIGLDINGCSSVFFELGIESFQGIHTYARNGNSCTIRYFPYGSNQDGYLTTTGTQTSDYTIKTLMGTTPTILPLSSRAYNINNGGNNIITFLDTYWYLDTVAPTNPVTHYLFHGDVLSSWILIGGGVSVTPASGLFATVLPVRTNNLLRMIKILGVRFGNSYFAPSGYEYVSEDLWRSTSYKTAAFTIGSPSTVTVTTPTGFKFREIDVFSNLGATAAAASSPVVIGNLSDTSRTYVCASTNTGLALRWKDYISVAV